MTKHDFYLYLRSVFFVCYSDERGRTCVQHCPCQQVAHGSAPVHRLKWCASLSQQTDHAYCPLWVSLTATVNLSCYLFHLLHSISAISPSRPVLCNLLPIPQSSLSPSIHLTWLCLPVCPTLRNRLNNHPRQTFILYSMEIAWPSGFLLFMNLTVFGWL